MLLLIEHAGNQLKFHEAPSHPLLRASKAQLLSVYLLTFDLEGSTVEVFGYSTLKGGVR